MKTYRKCKRLRGFIKLDVFSEDPLFKNITKKSKFLTKHCEVIKEAPKDFNILSSYKGFIYTIKHNKKLIYGTQFHPESSRAGMIILKNFVKMSQEILK